MILFFFFGFLSYIFILFIQKWCGFKSFFFVCLLIFNQGYGSWDDCFDHLVKLLAEQNQKVECVKRNCLLGMVRAPNLSLSNTELYGFSEYWFSMEDVLSLGGSYNFTTLAHEARKFCAQKWSTVLVAYFFLLVFFKEISIKSFSHQWYRKSILVPLA